MKTDENPYLQIALDVTSGMTDLRETMRKATHDEIATAYVRKNIQEAKQAPEPDD